MQRYSILILACLLAILAHPCQSAVVARAGTQQNVINTGTKVTARTASTTSNQKNCQTQYDACMDAFCILDNAPGGRCICSNKITQLNSQQEKIDAQNRQAYKLETTGVQHLETSNNSRTSKRSGRNVDLSAWETKEETEEVETTQAMGQQLFLDSHQICMKKLQECTSNADMLKIMYNQQIKSDCVTYENSLKQAQQASNEKMAASQRTLRSAAYKKLQAANKYDLGQCTIEFKKCMQTTAECGEDFTQCVTPQPLRTNEQRRLASRSSANHIIHGTNTSIEISTSTYDTLVAKKPLCESITKQCTQVANQVWDTFLREVAPQIKNAEIIATDKTRQDCIGNISACFQKACKDTIDPNDPDGSYDMCLSRPESMLSMCRQQLNACGIDTSSADKAQQSQIWDFVVARLASMRVDACTTEVKECLTSQDRCGKDYSQCVGLDTDTIIRMCPYDKLTGCQLKYGNKEIRGDMVYEELATMVQGLMINIENHLLSKCQNAVNESMLRVCGNTNNCNSMFAQPELFGSESLQYQLCQYAVQDDQVIISQLPQYCRASIDQITDTELGRTSDSTTGELGPITPYMSLINGTIYYEHVSVLPNGMLTDADTYFAAVDPAVADSPDKEQVADTINNLQQTIERIIETIESDPTVQYCMTGRQVPGMKNISQDGVTPRFPNLTQNVRMQITNSALKKAKDNYYQRYDQLNQKMLTEYSKLAERTATIRGENAKDKRRESARYSCISLAHLSVIPKSPDPPKNMLGTIIVAVAVVAITAVAMVATAGAAAPAGVTLGAHLLSTFGLGGITTGLTTFGVAAAGAGLIPTVTTALGTAVATGIVSGISLAAGGVAAGIAAGINAGVSGKANNPDAASATETTGFYEMEQWNYKEKVFTNFDMNTLKCTKCTTTTNCKKTKNPIFGNKSCKTWEEPQEKCVDIQF